MCRQVLNVLILKLRLTKKKNRNNKNKMQKNEKKNNVCVSVGVCSTNFDVIKENIFYVFSVFCFDFI